MSRPADGDSQGTPYTLHGDTPPRPRPRVVAPLVILASVLAVVAVLAIHRSMMVQQEPADAEARVVPDRQNKPGLRRGAPKSVEDDEAESQREADREYGYRREYKRLTMPDGVELGAAIFIPQGPHGAALDHKVPVILEYLPYRLGDSFYSWDYQKGSYFAQKGFAYANVDVRGTGSSDGVLPEREYSDQELDDASTVITLLANMPFSNGRVGMIGISWGAFNGLMMAARGHPDLHAVVALQGSEDLFYNDVHYMDGVLHFDEYILSMDLENALPQTPAYRLDDTWRRNRFEQTPWTLRYLRQQVDGPFWHKRSVMYSYSTMRTPLYMITGTYDSYKDFALRIYDGVRASQSDPPLIKVSTGPYDHQYPDFSTIGPVYDSRHESVRFFRAFLYEDDVVRKELESEPDVAMYIRDSHTPADIDAQRRSKAPEDPVIIPGEWRWEDWPVPSSRSTEMVLHPGPNQSLVPGRPDAWGGQGDRLRFKASAGVEMGVMFGELTPDMAPFDADSLIYDTPPLDEPLTVAGFGEARLRVRASSPLAHWVVRLECVSPDGQVSFVTGGELNGGHRDGREHPSYLTPGEWYDITIPIHFTTWRFRLGDRIRVAVGNSLFRVSWPTPHADMETDLAVGHPDSVITFPVLTEPSPYPAPAFTARRPEPAGANPPDAFPYANGTNYDEGSWYTRRVPSPGGEAGQEVVDVVWHADYYANTRGWLVCSTQNHRSHVDDARSEAAQWMGHATYLYIANVTRGARDDCGVGCEGTMASLRTRMQHWKTQLDVNGRELAGSTAEEPATVPNLDLSVHSWFELTVYINVTSTPSTFEVNISRQMVEDGVVVATKAFAESIPRYYQ